MKKESQRQKRISEQVKQLVAQAFYTTSLSADFSGEVTISNVNVSKDLKHAHVFFTLLGGQASAEDIADVTQYLNGYAKEINTHLARNMATKYTPRVKFFYDETYEEANRIDRLLRQYVPETEEESGDGAP